MKTLRTRVFVAAWQIVEKEGIDHLNVRKVAKLADCSLGSVYNAFSSFQELKLHINLQVLGLLFDELIKVTEKGIEEKKLLRTILKDLGFAYIAFAEKNPFLWKALFEHFSEEKMPDWYGEKARAGVYRICEQLADSFSQPLAEIKQQVGFFWASVHGMSAIILNRKMDMVSELFANSSREDYIDRALEGVLFQRV